MNEKHWFVYILECKDSTLYTGISNNVKKRLEEHNKGKGCKFTRCRYPVKLLFWERHDTQSAALKREAEIKSFPRKIKLELISSH